MTEAEIKIKARSAVFIALQAGRMQKQPCAKCGATEKVEAHHEDYSKPLEVVWYCKEHHRQRHNEIECRDALPTECVEMALVWKCRLCDYRWMVEDLGYPPVLRSIRSSSISALSCAILSATENLIAQNFFAGLLRSTD